MKLLLNLILSDKINNIYLMAQWMAENGAQAEAAPCDEIFILLAPPSTVKLVLVSRVDVRFLARK